MALNATLDTQISRVRLEADGLTVGAGFYRSMDGVNYTNVRGGTNVNHVSGVAKLDDYEFGPNQINYYKVISGANTFLLQYTPVQSGVWIKSITRPFLNRSVVVRDLSDIERPSRSQVFDVIGRSFPIAVTDVRGSRRWTATLRAYSVDEADALELAFASGDLLFIQTDGLNDIPDGYVVAGDMSRSRFGKISAKRDFVVSFTEIAPPGPSVVGSTNTWDSLVAEFGTWNNVISNFGSWNAVAEYVSSPSTVIVP